MDRIEASPIDREFEVMSAFVDPMNHGVLRQALKSAYAQGRLDRAIESLGGLEVRAAVQA